MHRNRYKAIALGVFTTLVVVAIFAFVYLRSQNDVEKQLTASSSSKTEALLKTIDSLYWENPDHCLKYINDLLSIAGKTSNYNAMALGLYYKSACFVIKERYDSAYIMCHLTLKFANEHNNELVSGKIKVVLANYHIAKNELNEANKYLIEAIPDFEKSGTSKDMANLFNGFGLLYYNLKEPDKAIEYYYKVIALSKEVDKKRQKLVAYLNISNCYRNKLDHKMTLYYLDKALKGFREINDSAFIMMCTLNLGIIHIDRGDKEKGLNYYTKVMDYSRRNDKKLLLGHTLFNIASVYYQSKLFNVAEKYFNESMDVYRSVSSKDGEKNVLHELSSIAKIKNNWKQAYEYYDRYIIIRDSIMNAGLLQDINELRWNYDFQKKENETAIIKKKIEVKHREMLLVIISFTFITVFILLFALLIRLKNKNLRKSDHLNQLQILYLQGQMAADHKINELERLRLKGEIEAKSKELATSSMQLLSKNEILESISTVTENYYKKKSIDSECYIKLKRIFKENLDQQKDWEHFKRLFEEVHTDFFKNLKTVCPKISESELRLCAYLKINLHNKEISKILNIAPDSLKTVRYRIRKKLGLNKDDSLEEYIRNL